MIGTMNNTRKKRLLATECSEPERSEGERNGGANNRAPAAPPNPEVSARPKRRQFTAAYKARIVEEVQQCTEQGQIGVILRREGLYSSAITLWRRQYQSGALRALKDDKRGRRTTRDPRDQELERQRREIEHLNKKLHKAELIIDIQKKVAALLGNPIETLPNDEDIS